MEAYVALIVIVVIVSVAALMGLVLWLQQRSREMATRERIALIERGLVPSPELDPIGFERLLASRRPYSVRGSRYRSAGIMTIGLGAALFVLLAFTAEVPGVGLGVGGGFVILGLAMFVNGTLGFRDDEAAMSAQPTAAPRHEPPSNVAP